MEDSVMKAYINSNTAELRGWLKGIGLLSVDYPECDRYNGLIAPYHIREGMPHEGKDVVIFYRDGVVYDTDDDAEDYYFCESEEEFKEKVLELTGK